MRIRFFDGLYQLVLTGGQVHGLHVKPFAFEFWIASNHHDGHIRVGGCVSGLLQGLRARLGRILRRIFTLHANAQFKLHTD